MIVKFFTKDNPLFMHLQEMGIQPVQMLVNDVPCLAYYETDDGLIWGTRQPMPEPPADLDPTLLPVYEHGKEGDREFDKRLLFTQMMWPEVQTRLISSIHRTNIELDIVRKATVELTKVLNSFPITISWKWANLDRRVLWASKRNVRRFDRQYPNGKKSFLWYIRRRDLARVQLHIKTTISYGCCSDLKTSGVPTGCGQRR